MTAEYSTQAEITKWEKSRAKAISGWQIEYGDDVDTITFFFYNNGKVTFKRIKP